MVDPQRPGSTTFVPVVGDPMEHRASFTRFIMPFAWSIDFCQMPDPGTPSYRRADSASDWIHPAFVSTDGDLPGDFTFTSLNIDRQRYFTRETNELLYKRAAWYVLDRNADGKDSESGKNVWKTATVQSCVSPDKRSFEVALRPPALILLEWEGAKGHLGKDDILANGLLVQEVFFPNKDSAPAFADLLALNEVFRCWRMPYRKHLKDCANLLHGLNNLVGDGLSGDEEDNRPYATQWLPFLRHPIHLSNNRYAKLCVPEYQHLSKYPFPKWVVYPDDRAFAVTFACVEQRSGRQEDSLLASAATDIENKTRTAIKSCIPGQSTDSLWLQLLNVDRPGEDASPRMVNEADYNWLKRRTYERWADYGTLYGFSEHSFSTLCEPGWSEGDDKYVDLRERSQGEPELGRHVAGLYFDTSMLLLYLRTTIFRISAELHKKSCEARDGCAHARNPQDWLAKFKHLRWQYFYLENLYQFPILSNQQQHLEMYDLQRKILDVHELYGEVAKEIRTGDELFENLLMEKRNRLAVMFNVIGFFGLTLALALGWMDARSSQYEGSVYSALLGFVGIYLVFFGVLTLIVTGVQFWLRDGLLRRILLECTWTGKAAKGVDRVIARWQNN
ncbi:MAG TPA: hypothetical protein PKE12_02185 [Kiritimatiellia bacterium]|nr:hypothetical protein [Kiritimatiellia bacterium]